MDCPECDRENIKKTCPACGWSAQPERERVAIESYHLSQTDPLRSVACAWRTGEWPCRWGKFTREKDARIFCDFHAEALRQNMTQTHDLWVLFLKEREFHVRTYPAASIVVMAADLKTGDHTPFWHRPIAEQWRVLTGLPLPAMAMAGHHDENQEDA